VATESESVTKRLRIRYKREQAAVEAAQHAWRPSSPWHRFYTETKHRHGKSNAAKAAVARKVLIACWHVLSLNQPFKPSASSATDDVPASSSIRLAA
jgi:hypothetical protein